MSGKETMRMLAFYGPEGFRIEEQPRPVAGPGKILLKVRACGICGGDYSTARRRASFPRPPAGVILGHEIVGEVAENPGQGPSAGSLVAVAPNRGCRACRPCRDGLPLLCERKTLPGALTGGGFAEYVLVEESQCHPIPFARAFVDFTLAEPLACCIHAADRASIGLGARVLVMGAGTNALLFIALSRLLGASLVAVADTRSSHLALAEGLGASITVPLALPEPQDFDGLGFDVVIVTRSAPAFIEGAFGLAKDRGRILSYGVADPGARISIEQRLLWEHQLSLIGTRSYEGMDFQKAFGLIAEGLIPAGNLVTRLVGLDEAGKALLEPGHQLKTVVMPWGEH